MVRNLAQAVGRSGSRAVGQTSPRRPVAPSLRRPVAPSEVQGGVACVVSTRWGILKGAGKSLRGLKLGVSGWCCPALSAGRSGVLRIPTASGAAGGT